MRRSQRLRRGREKLTWEEVDTKAAPLGEAGRVVEIKALSSVRVLERAQGRTSTEMEAAMDQTRRQVRLGQDPRVRAQRSRDADTAVANLIARREALSSSEESEGEPYPECASYETPYPETSPTRS